MGQTGQQPLSYGKRSHSLYTGFQIPLAITHTIDAENCEKPKSIMVINNK